VKVDFSSAPVGFRSCPDDFRSAPADFSKCSGNVCNGSSDFNNAPIRFNNGSNSFNSAPVGINNCSDGLRRSKRSGFGRTNREESIVTPISSAGRRLAPNLPGGNSYESP
jgi:hypothetical protein